MIWHFRRQNRLCECFMVKRLVWSQHYVVLIETMAQENLCFVWCSFFPERNGDMHRFAGTNLSCKFCTTARMDKLMRARRLAFTDVPETEMNKKKETAIHVHFCGWNTQERNWKKLQFKRKVSKKWSGISEGKIALVVKRLVWSQHYVNLIETT